MNAFSFIDETIRGTVRFFFGYIYSTLVLFFRPFAGPRYLYRRLKDPKADQISSSTYLAISILIGTPLLLALFGAVNDSASTFAAGQARALSRGNMEGLGALVGGALAGTIIVSGLLRLFAQLFRLKGRRNEQFVTLGEYKFGLIVICGVVIVQLASLLGTFEPSWRVAAGLPASILIVIVPCFFAVFDLWTALVRSPRALRPLRETHKSWLAIFREGPRAGFPRFSRAIRAIMGVPEGKPTIMQAARGQIVASAMFILWYGGMIILMSFALAAAGAGAYATNWLLAGESRKPVRLYGLSCIVERTGITASAMAWNRRDEPVWNWVPIEGFNIDLTVEVGGRSERRYGGWYPAAGARGDYLPPRQGTELRGPIRFFEYRPQPGTIVRSCEIVPNDTLDVVTQSPPSP